MDLKELNVEELSALDLENIDGGRSFWGDVAYVLGSTARYAYEISRSLRSNPAYGNANVYK